MILNDIRFWLLSVVLVFSLSSCSPSNIPVEYRLNEGGDQGILIIKLEKNGERKDVPAAIDIFKGKNRFFTNLNFKREGTENYYIIELPVGVYKFCNMQFKGFLPSKQRCYLDKKFKIEAGKILYAGIYKMSINRGLAGSIRWRIEYHEEYNNNLIEKISTSYRNIDFCKMHNIAGQSYRPLTEKFACEN
ncbi:MAG: hypothetical protein MJE63_11815 [Proteobacteria bacterium]|nr:hypothetical protein [Pseudomonadota bacterium]